MSNFSAESEEDIMAFVINLADSTGREYYFSVESEMIPLDMQSSSEPLVFKTTPQAERGRKNLIKHFPTSCTLYILERKDFEARRESFQNLLRVVK